MIPLTKIIATLGPSTSSEKQISGLMKAGASIFRLNFSHGSYEDHLERIRIIRSLAKKNKTHCTILADMQGPKLRVGHFDKGQIILKQGQIFTLDTDKTPGNEKRVQLPHPEIFKVLKAKMNLLLNDGKIVLNVQKVTSKQIVTKVVVGGELSDHKGVNVPDVILPISALTEKDRKDLKFALNADVDWICLSFVQKADDIRIARRLIGSKAMILAKIEKPAAVQNIAEIVTEADAIMVARGDLGVECPIASVPGLQRKIIAACRLAGKPVVVATQMLESMIEAPVPTRAEVSDIATAVCEGADAIMLSAETAAGKNPIQAVQTMREVILQTQSDPDYHQYLSALRLPLDGTVACAITSSMRRMIQSLEHPACIATYSVSGRTTLRVARERALVPILGMTMSEKTANQMGLIWGVVPVLTKTVKHIGEVAKIATEHARKTNLIKHGDQMIITAGYPFGHRGSTNILHIVDIT